MKMADGTVERSCHWDSYPAGVTRPVGIIPKADKVAALLALAKSPSWNMPARRRLSLVPVSCKICRRGFFISESIGLAVEQR